MLQYRFPIHLDQGPFPYSVYLLIPSSKVAEGVLKGCDSPFQRPTSKRFLILPFYLSYGMSVKPAALYILAF